jgi:drug/metabolite transporter (DMT)-like permease
MSDNMRGVLLMCAAMLAFTVNDSFMKSVSEDIPLFQAIFLRGVGASLGLLLLAFVRFGRVHLLPSRNDVGVLSLRTMAEVVSTLTFLTALMHMPLATLSAIMQSLPLVVTLAAAVIYREKISWQVWAAIGAGFVGVMLIIKPGLAGFDRWSVLGLISVLFVALRDLSTRHVSPALGSITMAIWAAVFVALLGALGALWQGWQDIPPMAAFKIIGATLALVVGYLTVVMVMRVGDIAVVAPFRYTSLIWALLFGWMFFDSLPDSVALLGAAIVAISGIYTLWHAARKTNAAVLRISE